MQAKRLSPETRPSGLSGVGEEVKLHEPQYETKRSVLGGTIEIGLEQAPFVFIFYFFPNLNM
jgi:hypothetical protein